MSEQVTKLLEELARENSRRMQLRIMADVLGELGLIHNTPQGKLAWSGIEQRG